MPTTKDQNDLPFVDEEIEEVKTLLSSCTDVTVMQSPSREQVMSALSNSQIVHLSCHGYSAPDPSKSALLLGDSPLTVSDLTSLSIEFAEFAYLSACHTSSTRDFNLLDESISLSSAIQLSGYPSVVSTLWQVADRSSAEVARDVYSWILDGRDKLDIDRSAEGLHWAVRALRDRTCTVPGLTKKAQNDPLVWAPYIHVGV